MHLIHPTEVLTVLSEHIDPENIPRKYGGTLDYEFGDMPHLDPDLVEGFTWAEGVSRLPIGPIKWEEDGGGMKMLAVGTKRGVKRRMVVGRLDRSYKGVFYPTNGQGTGETEVD